MCGCVQYGRVGVVWWATRPAARYTSRQPEVHLGALRRLGRRCWPPKVGGAGALGEHVSQGAMAEEKVPALVQDLSRAAWPVLSAERLSAVCWYNNCKKQLCPLLVQLCTASCSNTKNTGSCRPVLGIIRIILYYFNTRI